MNRRYRLTIVAGGIFDDFVGNDGISFSRDDIQHRLGPDQLAERGSHPRVAQFPPYHGDFLQHLLEAIRHVVLRELGFQRARHAARDLVERRQNAVFVVLIDRKAGGLAHALKMIGHGLQEAFVEIVRVAEKLDIGHYALSRRHRRAVGHWPAGGMQDADPERDGVKIGFARLAEDVVGMKLDRLSMRIGDNDREKRR